MLPHILPLIPKHEVYTEAFFGGGAVFWAKEKVKTEIINDFNANVYTFYKVLQTRFAELQTLIKQSTVSREAYKAALVIYHAPFAFTEIQQAWAFWYATNCGYSNQVGNCRITTNSKNVSVLNNKIVNFTDIYSTRLQGVQIDNSDACEVISLRDTPDTFHYVDPPYVGAKQGHYGGYEQSHFNELLATLAKVKGKFLLSSYPNDELNKYVQQYGWRQKEITMHLGSSNSGKKRLEVLTANYPI
nr:MAG TPA: DNA adenine methylase [Bacteriophage sp.]